MVPTTMFITVTQTSLQLPVRREYSSKLQPSAAAGAAPGRNGRIVAVCGAAHVHNVRTELADVASSNMLQVRQGC